MFKRAVQGVLGKLNGSNRVNAGIDQLRSMLDRADLDAMHVAVRECLDRLADLESIALRDIAAGPTIVTDYPVAVMSDDQTFPRGVRSDNSRHPRFVRAVEQLFNRRLRHLDLGCAGGGLVLDFLLRGHDSVGVEGSDFALREQRAEWRTIPGRLFTGDITKPFWFRAADGSRSKFDVMTAWEVLEHIPEAALPGLCDNIRENLADDGIFVASVATFEDRDPVTGAVWHVTLKPRDWWMETFASHGLEARDGCFHARDYVRGTGNPRVGPSGAWDWDVERDPELGFHVTLEKHAG